MSSSHDPAPLGAAHPGRTLILTLARVGVGDAAAVPAGVSARAPPPPGSVTTSSTPATIVKIGATDGRAATVISDEE